MRISKVVISKEALMQIPSNKELDITLGCPAGTKVVSSFEDVNTRSTVFFVENVCFEDFIHESDYPVIEVNIKECLKDKEIKYELSGDIKEPDTKITLPKGWGSLGGSILKYPVMEPGKIWYVSSTGSADVPMWTDEYPATFREESSKVSSGLLVQKHPKSAREHLIMQQEAIRNEQRKAKILDMMKSSSSMMDMEQAKRLMGLW